MDQSGRIVDEAFGQRLQHAIKRMYPSQKSLADSLGISERAMTCYCSGALPRGDHLVRLAHALPGQIEWVMTGRELPRPKVRPARSDILRELVEFLETLPEFVLQEILWHLKALYEYGKVGDAGIVTYVRRVRGE
jgi:transcriptional regulator with XRE-family HTH domain